MSKRKLSDDDLIQMFEKAIKIVQNDNYDEIYFDDVDDKMEYEPTIETSEIDLNTEEFMVKPTKTRRLPPSFLRMNIDAASDEEDDDEEWGTLSSNVEDGGDTTSEDEEEQNSDTEENILDAIRSKKQIISNDTEQSEEQSESEQTDSEQYESEDKWSTTPPTRRSAQRIASEDQSESNSEYNEQYETEQDDTSTDTDSSSLIIPLSEEYILDSESSEQNDEDDTKYKGMEWDIWEPYV